MNSKDEKGFSCKTCIGNCCTFTSNSMMISPLEAYDIYVFLKNSPSFDERKLKASLEKNIKEFRLENIDLGVRKTYTCPFYTGAKKGCTISRHSKPYGCLGFLPTQKAVNKGNDCRSDIGVLKKRELKFKQEEEQLNSLLKKSIGLCWDKLPISSAVLSLLENIKKY
tara:strand:- start:516 stop:1016 length:501 start_codon:yes stop_codon:yes gene_type:complete